jgi:hypothetical protein
MATSFRSVNSWNAASMVETWVSAPKNFSNMVKTQMNHELASTTRKFFFWCSFICPIPARRETRDRVLQLRVRHQHISEGHEIDLISDYSEEIAVLEGRTSGHRCDEDLRSKCVLPHRLTNAECTQDGYFQPNASGLRRSYPLYAPSPIQLSTKYLPQVSRHVFSFMSNLYSQISFGTATCSS